MNKKSFLLVLLMLGVIFSCKREKVEVIGPIVMLASPNFKIETPFTAEYSSIGFSTTSNWFNVAFNERVSWIVSIKSLTSKAEKTITGTSKLLYNLNSTWTGGHSGLYFFKPGDKVVAELTVFGWKEKLYDTITITNTKTNYGSDVILWWDMDLNGVAKNGTVYWFDYYDGDSNPAEIGKGERMEDLLTNPHSDNDPVQGIYRGMEGQDGLASADYYIGAAGHTFIPASSPIGFNTSLDNVFLNFYIRRRTTTSAMGITLTSIGLVGDTSIISYGQKIDFEGWKLISVRLSDMIPDSKYKTYPFNPARIAKFAMNLSVHTTKGEDHTGFDIDFITFTKDGPFNPDKY